MSNIEKRNHPTNLSEVFALVLAGGQGKRLWPLSRKKLPKQFLPLTKSNRTLMQVATTRAKEIVGSMDNVLVSTQVEHATLVRQQLPELLADNLIIEPLGRNTAASIGLAAMAIQKRAKDPVMIVLPADHLLLDEQPWLEAVNTAATYAAESEDLVTIGIPPVEPSSNYGYLHKGEIIHTGVPCPVYRVKAFFEKPNAATAATYIESQEYLWNTGTFAWRISIFQKALRKHLPGMFSALKHISLNPASIHQVLPTVESVSIDYGVLEKSSNLAVVQGSFQRIDVGSLVSLFQILPEDEQGNATMGEMIAKDSQNNIIYTDTGLIGLIGIDNLIVIRHQDVVLICPKDRATEVKDLVALLNKKELNHYQ
jgi:mannose-1-phosphate guanylyltransferase